jgi:regulatory protein
VNREPGPRKPSLAERRARRGAVEDPQVVMDAALRFLEARSRSIAEVRRRLRDAGYRPDLVEGAIDRLLALGMLDDAAFAAAWVESRDRARPRGERALRQELRLKGVDPATVDALLEDRRSGAEAEGRSADEAAAERILQRHARALARTPDPRAARQRAYALLARSGIDPETAARASARFAAATEAGDAEEGDVT